MSMIIIIKERGNHVEGQNQKMLFIHGVIFYNFHYHFDLGNQVS